MLSGLPRELLLNVFDFEPKITGEIIYMIQFMKITQPLWPGYK